MMKRLSIIAACLLISCMALAQGFDGPRFNVRLGAGIPGAGADKFVEGLSSGHYGLQSIYDDYYTDTKAIPAVSAEFLYQINEWLRCGASVVYGSYSNQRIDGIAGTVKEDRNGQTYVVMPTAQVSYYEKGALRMYMGLYIGAGYYSGFDNLAGKMSFEVQFAPLGIEFGGRVYGFAEGCLGTAINWVHGGVGFRF